MAKIQCQHPLYLKLYLSLPEYSDKKLPTSFNYFEYNFISMFHFQFYKYLSPNKLKSYFHILLLSYLN